LSGGGGGNDVMVRRKSEKGISFGGRGRLFGGKSAANNFGANWFREIVSAGNCSDFGGSGSAWHSPHCMHACKRHCDQSLAFN
jgi:hypothetical protein